VGKSRCTYRKRDLRVAREIAHDGDTVEVKKDGTIVIKTGKPGEANGDTVNPWDKAVAELEGQNNNRM
jgi:hypothetical protein